MTTQDIIPTTPKIERIGPGRYLVQSKTRSGVRYTVDLNANRCDCPASVICWHIRCCRIRRIKARRSSRIFVGDCAECGVTDANHYEPVPIGDLTYFAGDELCGSCANNHGI